MTANQEPPDQPPPLDKATLKSALKMFRKRLKATQLDDESGLGGRALTAGARSGIAGIRPPDRFPAVVWEELVRQGRLKSHGSGLYGLVD
jgi:hypothetical protein